MPTTDEHEVRIDTQRSIATYLTETGSIVLSAEDPHTIAVVEIPAEQARELYDELGRKLGLHRGPVSGEEEARIAIVPPVTVAAAVLRDGAVELLGEDDQPWFVIERMRLIKKEGRDGRDGD